MSVSCKGIRTYGVLCVVFAVGETSALRTALPSADCGREFLGRLGGRVVSYTLDRDGLRGGECLLPAEQFGLLEGVILVSPDEQHWQGRNFCKSRLECGKEVVGRDDLPRQNPGRFPASEGKGLAVVGHFAVVEPATLMAGGDQHVDEGVEEPAPEAPERSTHETGKLFEAGVAVHGPTPGIADDRPAEPVGRCQGRS